MSDIKNYIVRIERLEEEIANIRADTASVYKELSNAGYDKAVVREIIKVRKKDKSTIEEQAQLMELYMKELGDLYDTPLGIAARVGGGSKDNLNA